LTNRISEEVRARFKREMTEVILGLMKQMAEVSLNEVMHRPSPEAIAKLQTGKILGSDSKRQSHWFVTPGNQMGKRSLVITSDGEGPTRARHQLFKQK
jgi:hypothetical protein